MALTSICKKNKILNNNTIKSFASVYKNKKLMDKCTLKLKRTQIQ